MLKGAPADSIKMDAATATEPTSGASSEGDPLAVAVEEIRSTLSVQRGALQTAERSLKRLEREVKRLRQAARAGAAARRAQKGKRKPTGFARPGPVTTALLAFLDRQPGEHVARTEVTREVNAYIKAHQLQDPGNAKVILPDAKLGALLAVESGTDLTYFSLQKHLNPHFIRAPAQDSGD